MTITPAARRRTLFSRTLVLTALLVVAAAGSVFSVRSARADAPRKNAVPAEVTPEAQAIASLLVGQSMGNASLGASAMQVLWGGAKNDDPPKGAVLPRIEIKTSGAQQRPNPRGIAPRDRKATSAKSE